MTLFSNQPGDEGLPGHERARVMAAVMTTTLMGVFDGTMINIALPSMARAMQVPANVAVWFANGYLLSAAMTLAIFAALAARVGYRPVFLAGLATFTLTSLGCALAKTPDMLIGMRILQGIGGAATLSIAPAILRSVFPGRLLGRILGLHALLIAASTAIAPVLGGTILDVLSWQWLFAINLVPGSIALLLAWRALPRQSDVDGSPFDAPGAALSAVLLGSAIMLADSLQHITQGINPAAAGWGLLTLVSAIAFVWRIRRARSPILPPVMFRNGRFTLAALTSLASFVSQGITFVALPFLFQSVYGYSPVVSALLFTPWPIGIVLIAPHAGRWADTLSAPLISTIGLMIFVGGLVLLATLPENPSAWNICLRSLVCGIGFGCFQSPNNREMLANVAREHASYASGVLSIVRTFGQCLGAAAVGVLLATTGSDHDRAVHLARWIAVIASTGSVLFSLSRLRPGVRASA
ncbi:MFS transporter [Enterobacter cloacae complex sp. P3B]|uniref:MFS transporter n=1 Tax=Enterobacter TaxID=547 RepID=UPI000667D13E|nr:MULTISPECIES: MFS transporter [Enterobacter]MBE3177404.1 MFS transporter [Enterobacter cloacae complex sp. P26RS]MBE3432798.1 MFS transporter [Enterobacter cloacae complex sp. P21RS]MBE3458810.1 MFS transporter [Enterobacter cloacae complex sp. P21C]MBE3499294.1 MFS transporter [Enterobacter cloacae complex sp. P2B]MBE3502094.1 MFS transporter [Enterobacter cloacae complex sp. I11]